MNPKTERAARVLAAAIKQFHEALAAEARPEPPIGSVVRWQRSYDGNGRRYDWAAIRTVAGWYTTGTRGMTGRLSWAGVLDQVGDAQLYLANGWYPMGDQPGVDLDDIDRGDAPSREAAGGYEAWKAGYDG